MTCGPSQRRPRMTSLPLSSWMWRRSAQRMLSVLQCEGGDVPPPVSGFRGQARCIKSSVFTGLPKTLEQWKPLCLRPCRQFPVRTATWMLNYSCYLLSSPLLDADLAYTCCRCDVEANLTYFAPLGVNLTFVSLPCFCPTLRLSTSRLPYMISGHLGGYN